MSDGRRPSIGEPGSRVESSDISRMPPRILFVTGRLAEFALRQVLDELAPARRVRRRRSPSCPSRSPP